MPFLEFSSRRNPFREAEQLKQVMLGCAEGKRVCMVVSGKSSQNSLTAKMIRIVGVSEVHRWKRDGLLNFKIV